MDGNCNLLNRIQNLSALLSTDKDSAGELFPTLDSALKAKYGPFGESPEDNTKDDWRSRKAKVELGLFSLEKNRECHGFSCPLNL